MSSWTIYSICWKVYFSLYFDLC